jgi:hypothetical protein
MVDLMKKEDDRVKYDIDFLILEYDEIGKKYIK